MCVVIFSVTIIALKSVAQIFTTIELIRDHFEDREIGLSYYQTKNITECKLCGKIVFFFTRRTSINKDPLQRRLWNVDPSLDKRKFRGKVSDIAIFMCYPFQD